MAEGDKDKTTFFAGEGVFCYRKMPFGLKNAGATYQRLVDKVFHDQIGRNLEAYVDDIVIKSTSEEDMLADIKETFERFRSINMKLNPKKCSFGVEEGLFLGHLITKQSIRANPSKIKAITDVEQPKMLKDIQSLNGKLAARKCSYAGVVLASASSNGSGAGLMLIDPEGKEYTYALRFEFEITNNEAEYEALLAGLRIAQLMEIVLVEVLAKRSIEEKEILQVETKEEESWMTLIHEYLVSVLLPEDPKESRKVRVKAPQYKMIRGSLYQRVTLNGGQNYEARILLALDAQRRRKSNSRLREMQGAICDKEGSRKGCNKS
ncbi:reverse transcriptase domain-containing protein [Tanacetum coccineum]